MAGRARFLTGSAFIALAMTASPALAQSDMINTVLESIGITSPEKDPIDYRERAPLVVPPDAKRLRSPEAPAAQRNAAWPQDPDVLERKRKAAEANVSRFSIIPGNDRTERMSTVTGAHPALPRALPQTNRNAADEGRRDNVRVLTPEQVGNIMSESTASRTPSGIEPKREYLTEPPTGYRQAARGAPIGRPTQEPFPNQSEHIDMNIYQKKN